MLKIDCKKIRERMLEAAELKLNKIYWFDHIRLKLVIIQIGDDPASSIYIRNKIKTCEKLNVEYEHVKLPELTTFDMVANTITKYNLDKTTTGIILQLPLPDHLKDKQQILLNLIDGWKDVDGLTDFNKGRLWSGRKCIKPATAEAVMKVLPENLELFKIVLLGRSDLVGKPLIKMLMDKNATVTVCHSKTYITDRKEFIKGADIVISAIGKAESIDTRIYGQKFWIDVSINKNSNGQICGDFIIDEDDNSYSSYTPVPGGIGILTTAQLILNLIKCHELKHEPEVI